ncbi:MAG: hypothetical protein M1454_01505 [Candidatus Thermoplasmatota archaeon]|nr:hypothetical protein [Candidatus Thermoplasmatota archaeon]MCL5731292.1 hypothetical protein [Candidatus Thermoplasmatota archaeon]
MYEDLESEMFWTQFAVETLIFGKRKVMKNSREKIPDISTSGLFRISIGERKGQSRDWRMLIEITGRSVHVLEYPDRYESHVDEFDPSVRPIEHLVVDKGMEDIAGYLKRRISRKK